MKPPGEDVPWERETPRMQLRSAVARAARVCHHEELGEPVVCARQELFQTAADFGKLKAELGGVRGNILGNQVLQVSEEVSELIKSFDDYKYDPLDPAEEVSGCGDGSVSTG